MKFFFSYWYYNLKASNNLRYELEDKEFLVLLQKDNVLFKHLILIPFLNNFNHKAKSSWVFKLGKRNFEKILFFTITVLKPIKFDL